jgi:hypothetical protein
MQGDHARGREALGVVADLLRPYWPGL